MLVIWPSVSMVTTLDTTTWTVLGPFNWGIVAYGYFSFCLTSCNMDSLRNRTNFEQRVKLSPVFKHGFLRSEENVDINNKKSGVIYRYKCDRVDCDEEYIGESSRTFGERFKEHQKAPSIIYNNYNTTGHKINIDNFSIVGRKDQNLMRTNKEALYIGVNNPSLNRNIGKYHLPHIWDEFLFNTSE